MANKALVTWRADARSPMSSAREFAAVDNMGMGVTAEETPGGTLISGSDEQYRALESQGFRVKVLPDTNLLRIGRYTIDVEADAEAPAAERAFSISDAAPDAERRSRPVGHTTWYS